MLLTPFGPLIYKSEISEDFLKYLQKMTEDTRNNGEEIGRSLAGNIEGQYDSTVEGQQFMEFIHPHIVEYIKGCDERWQDIKTASLGVKEKTIGDIGYNLGSHGPWLNIQKKNEFNPVHSHAGEISAALMIDVPLEIEEERQQWTDKSNMPCIGQLDFINDTGGYQWPGSFKVIPKTGDLYLFPANLKHCVYPFHCDVERVTMSFNVFDVTYNDMGGV